MRTAKEIRQYLKCQPWYKDFVYNNKKYGFGNKAYKKYTLRGYRHAGTISRAFSWCSTKEGLTVWVNRDVAFRAWYVRGRNILITKN